jgi:hypothetical protein
MLIRELTTFANFYEQASAEIEHASPPLKPYTVGTRDANAEYMRRQFRATIAIERVRAYVLARYGEELTIATSRRLLGDLIRTCALSVAEADVLPLEAAIDRLEATAAHGPRVVLRDRDKGPIVLGKSKPVLTKAQYNVVKALMDAGEAGLTKDTLVSKSGHQDARGILSRLAKRDKEWKNVIHFPGQPGGGYRIG